MIFTGRLLVERYNMKKHVVTSSVNIAAEFELSFKFAINSEGKIKLHSKNMAT